MKHPQKIVNRNRRLRARLAQAERDFNLSFTRAVEYMKRAVVAESQLQKLAGEHRALRAELASYSLKAVTVAASAGPYDAGHSPAAEVVT